MEQIQIAMHKLGKHYHGREKHGGDASFRGNHELLYQSDIGDNENY
jgi:hypothetical protein